MKKRTLYYARWHDSHANVSFEAWNVEQACKRANKIARDLRIPEHLHRDITADGRVVHYSPRAISP